MIFYFSATGNSQYVATQIAKATHEEIISITECIKRGKFSFHLKSGETVGVISPTYFWGLPSIVSDFLDKLTLTAEETPYTYYISTYGTTTGQSSLFAKQHFQKIGYSLQASFSIKMPDTWTPIFDLTDLDKNNKLNQRADFKIIEVINEIKAKTCGDFMKNKVPKLAVKLYRPYYEKARQTHHFLVDHHCIGCTLCAKKCPVNAIKIEDKRPVWVEDKCTLCLGCLHRCPKFSIQYGKNTRKHGQYIHPGVRM